MVLSVVFRALLLQGQMPCLSFVLPVCVAGLTWEECIAQCPQGVVPACHNAEDTVTISGPQVTRFPGFSQYSTSLLYLSFMYYITHVITVTLSLIYSQIQ